MAQRIVISAISTVGDSVTVDGVYVGCMDSLNRNNRARIAAWLVSQEVVEQGGAPVIMQPDAEIAYDDSAYVAWTEEAR